MRARGKYRTRVAVMLAGAFVAIGLLTAVSDGVAIVTFGRFGSAFASIASDKLPHLVALSRLAQECESMVANAPALLFVERQFERQSVRDQIDDQMSALDSLLRELGGAIDPDALASLERQKASLAENIFGLDKAVGERIETDAAVAERTGRVVTLSDRSDALLGSAAVTSLKGGEAVAALRFFAALNRELSIVSAVPSAPLQDKLDTLHRHYEAAAMDVVAFASPFPRALADEALKLQRDLAAEAEGNTGLFKLREIQLVEHQTQSGLFGRNRMLSSQLTSTVATIQARNDRTVSDDNGRLRTEMSAISRVIVVLAMLSILTIAMSTTYIYRHVVRRLTLLATSMRARVDGDVVPIPTAGQDEISELGGAFEFFVEAIENREAILRQTQNELHEKAAALESSLARLNESQEQLERQRDILEKLSATDGLTGLANRRRFDEELTQECGRARRSESPVALILIDVDHFKAFNDRYGHVEGDQCLRRVAAVIAGAARRATDLAARYGGEEFALILPETDRDAAMLIAEELRHAVEALAIRHLASESGRVVTISLGIAVAVPATEDAVDSLIDEADRRLYDAKRAGRNRVA